MNHRVNCGFEIKIAFITVRIIASLEYKYNLFFFHFAQLEDDIVATPDYASTIKTFALQQETNKWLILEFSALGFIGKVLVTKLRPPKNIEVKLVY